jgi:hypothetical protein
VYRLKLLRAARVCNFPGPHGRTGAPTGSTGMHVPKCKSPLISGFGSLRGRGGSDSNSDTVAVGGADWSECRTP